jgi:hypothetical protein
MSIPSDISPTSIPWFFENKLQRADSLGSNCSHEEQEELILHPNLSKIQSSSRYDADHSSILQGAFGGVSKQFKYRESPAAAAALQQRAAWAAALKQHRSHIWFAIC